MIKEWLIMCSDLHIAFNESDPCTWSDANLPAGYEWREIGATGCEHLFAPDGRDLSALGKGAVWVAFAESRERLHALLAEDYGRDVADAVMADEDDAAEYWADVADDRAAVASWASGEPMPAFSESDCSTWCDANLPAGYEWRIMPGMEMDLFAPDGRNVSAKRRTARMVARSVADSLRAGNAVMLSRNASAGWYSVPLRSDAYWVEVGPRAAFHTC